MKEFTAELTPDLEILCNVMKRVDIFSDNPPKTKPTKGISKGSAKSPNVGLAATGTSGLGAVKIILIALIGSTVIGGSIFGISKLFSEKNSAGDFVEDTLEEKLSDKDEIDLEETESEESTEVISSISPNDEALEQYKIVVEQASTYKFSDDYYFSPTGNYQYALVHMNLGDPVQTLLLAQEVSNGDSYVRIFQYDTNSKVMHQPYNPPIIVNFSSGRTSANVSLSKMANGDGLRIFGVSRGIGEVLIQKVTLDGDNLNIEDAYTGKFDDNIPAELDGVEIEWHNSSDLSIFDTQLDN
jgi:hypothetical protein